ncbi:unnamed protein product [Cunninghamella blakesleeana]
MDLTNDSGDNSMMNSNETVPLLGNRQSTAKRANPWHIIGPVFLLTLGLGALLAPMVEFYTDIFCDLYYQPGIGDGDKQESSLFSLLKSMSSNSNDDFPEVRDCSIPEVQVIVSQVLGIVAFLSSASSFLVAGFYGSLSDRYGRRIVFQLFAIGGIAMMLCYICVSILDGYIDGVLLILAPIIRGLLVGELILGSNIQAYLADCTTPEERTVAFGHIFASLLGGVTLGPTLGSLLIKETGTLESVFYFSLFTYICFYIYVTFFLPESLDPTLMEKARRDYKNRPKVSFLQKINVFSTLSVIIYTKPKRINRYALPILAAIQCTVAAVASPPLLLYAMLTFGWKSYEGGFILSVTSGVRLVVTLILLPFLMKLYQSYVQKRLNQKNIEENGLEEEEAYYQILFNIWMTRLGLSIESLGFILMALATGSLSFTMFAALQAFGILGQPTMKALYSTLVDPSEIGTLLGSQSLLESIVILISQPGLSYIYSKSVETQPNLTFYVCGIVGFIGVLLAFFVHPVRNSTNHYHA